MSVSDNQITERPERLRLRQQWVTRILAGALIVVGLFQWAVIVEAIELDSRTFSEMSGAWQWATINLAVAYPVASVGLWLLAPWGLVIWIYAAGFQIAMHSVFSATFGFALIPIAIQLGLLAAFLAMAIIVRQAEATTVAGNREERRVVNADRPVGTGRYTAAAKDQIARRLAPRRQSESVEGGGRVDSERG